MFADANNAISAWLTQRDQSAARWLVHSHRPLVLNLARRWGAPAEMEEDVLQEVFLRVFKALPRLDLSQPFAPWLMVLARNTCSKLRRRWCHRHQLSACFENAAMDVSDCDLPDGGHAAQALTDQERRMTLEQSLRRLSAQRQLIEMQYFDDRSPADIATSMNVTAGSVRVALHRARLRLGQELQKQDLR